MTESHVSSASPEFCTCKATEQHPQFPKNFFYTSTIATFSPNKKNIQMFLNVGINISTCINSPNITQKNQEK